MLLRLLHLMPPETAHRLAIAGLAHGLVPTMAAARRPQLATRLCGLQLPNPLGLAAGFDKNAEAVAGLARLGFGFIEVGTITPRPQTGNPRPRLFRLPEQQALINRLGFNNRGLEAARTRLATRRLESGVVGANIGANRDSADPIADYVRCLAGLYPLVDYVTVNVSSPNTPGLRQLQTRTRLRALLEALLAERRGLAAGQPPKPLLVKIAPDLTAPEEAEIAEVVLAFGVDGLIIGNTTLDRPATLTGPYRNETGGLSGPPLFPRATAQLGRFHRLTDGRLPLIGVGGIASGGDAYAKIKAGASAVQLCTALVYQGPGSIGRMIEELDELRAADGFARIDDAIGVAAADRARPSTRPSSGLRPR